MKHPIVLLLVFNVLLVFSQKTEDPSATIYYKNTTCRASFDKVHLTGDVTAQTVERYLKINLVNLKDYRTGLKLNYVKQSPGGIHYSFTQTFMGVEIYQSEVKVNTDHSGTIRSLFDNSENTSWWNIEVSTIGANNIIALNSQTGLPVLCTRRVTDNSMEILESINGGTVFERDMKTYAGQDSLVSGWVFNPDPLTSAVQSYGFPYSDNSDRSNPWLQAEHQSVNFYARFDNGLFSLENDFVAVRDFDGPFIAPVTSDSAQFYYTRLDDGFEDVNAFYHISNMHNYINSLGFDCSDSFVEVDVHAVGGQDQSYFSSSQLPQRLYFGEGGVDDAEDADVCVHEYGHFVSETAAPNSNFGVQRNAIDEGFGDYLAGSYSRAINGYNDYWVFNWDGHNNFWNGRVLNSPWVYPDDINSNIYHNGQIWGTCLFCINSAIGRLAADSVVLQALYSNAQNLSMPDAGQLLLDADTILTGGKYACPIYNCLFQRGLHPANPFINCTVGMDDMPELSIRFINDGGRFTILNPDAEKLDLQIVNMQGQQVFRQQENRTALNYSNQHLPIGVYLVNVRVNTLTKTFKWINTGL